MTVLSGENASFVEREPETIERVFQSQETGATESEVCLALASRFCLLTFRRPAQMLRGVWPCEKSKMSSSREKRITRAITQAKFQTACLSWRRDLPVLDILHYAVCIYKAEN